MANDAAAYAALRAEARNLPTQDVDEIVVRGLPIGIWKAQLLRLRTINLADEETMEIVQKLEWTWRVELEDDEVEHQTLTSTLTGPTTTFAKIVKALNEEVLSPGQRIRPSVDLVGRWAMLVVEHVEGKTRIASYQPVKAK